MEVIIGLFGDIIGEPGGVESSFLLIEVEVQVLPTSPMLAELSQETELSSSSGKEKQRF